MVSGKIGGMKFKKTGQSWGQGWPVLRMTVVSNFLPMRNSTFFQEQRTPIGGQYLRWRRTLVPPLVKSLRARRRTSPDMLPPLLAVVCCLSCYCPCVPSLSVSLLLHSATPGCFGSASVSLLLGLPSKGNSTVVVHFFPQDMSNPAPSPPSDFLAYQVCTCHPQHFLVCHMLLPSDAENSSEALRLEDVELLLLCFCHLPCFTPIEMHWKHYRLEVRALPWFCCWCFLRARSCWAYRWSFHTPVQSVSWCPMRLFRASLLAPLETVHFLHHAVSHSQSLVIPAVVLHPLTLLWVQFQSYPACVFL